MKLLNVIEKYKSALAAAEKELQLHCTKVSLYGDFVETNKTKILECGSVDEPTILVVDSTDPEEVYNLLNEGLNGDDSVSFAFHINGKSYFS